MLSVTPSGRKSRRLDLHQHHSAYKADAFLSRATSANRVTERNRTAVKQIHSLSPVTSTGPGHSGRRGNRTLKAVKLSRLPTGSRRQSGCPSVFFTYQQPDQDLNLEHLVRSET